MSIWDWVLEAYGQPGVPQACLTLQDEHGQNTSFLLWAVHAEAKDPELLARAAAAAKAWERTALGLYMTKTILGCALGESVSLFGMVLGFLGAALPMCIPFFIAGALVQAFHYPRRSSMLNEAGGVLAIRFANSEPHSSQ